MRTTRDPTTTLTWIFILIGVAALAFVVAGVMALDRRQAREEAYFSLPPERVSFEEYLGCAPRDPGPHAMPKNPCKEI